jgi:hypothetical protein
MKQVHRQSAILDLMGRETALKRLKTAAQCD